MTAEPIAQAVADLRAGRVRPLVEKPLADILLGLAQCSASVVDATAIYRSLPIARGEEMNVYQDHPCIAPPFEQALISYVDKRGVVVVLDCAAIDRQAEERRPSFAALLDSSGGEDGSWQTAEPVEWQRVRWEIETFAWLRAWWPDGTPGPMAGPGFCWRFAVYDTGEPADLHWIQLSEERPVERWTNAHLTLLGALNFLNCRNVEMVEPQRPRAERRRLERIGVQVHELTVYPVSRRSSSTSTGLGAGVPLTSVRGRYSHYGNCCPGRHEPHGRLFGRLDGRFWVPQHARGSREHGVHETHYKLRPG